MRLGFASIPVVVWGMVAQVAGTTGGPAEEIAPETPVTEQTAVTQEAEPEGEKPITRSDRSREKQFRRAEQLFLKWDLNENLVIDDEEWTAIFEEQRAGIPKDEWEQNAEKLSAIDADKDGKLTDEELNAWLKGRFLKAVKRYTNSELYKSRKAEHEKQQAEGKK
jgi:hypothetical protein